MAEHPYPGLRPTWAEIDLAAVRHNTRVLRALAAPAAFCAVVKADAYGHGSVPVATAALEAGATWLAVALVEEGVALRRAGIDAPVLVLSEPDALAMAAVVDHGLTPTLYTAAGVAAAAAAAAGARAPVDVHVKVDTGMHRVGADPDAVAALVTAIDHAPGLRFAALWSHLAVADGPGPDDRAFTDRQIRCFQETATALAAAGHRPPLLHMANSAGTIAYAGARFDMIRIGIALYGVAPTPALDPQRAAGGGTALHPVLSWHSRVSMVRTLDPGERPSYGRRRPLAERSLVATVPVGYADGVPRRYGADGGCVLIAGRRCPLAGTVTMDQIVVDCGPDADVAIGDDVVLIGRQGPASLAVQDWADVLGTIGNEVLTEIGSRVPRVVVDSDATGGPAGEEENR